MSIKKIIYSTLFIILGLYLYTPTEARGTPTDRVNNVSIYAQQQSQISGILRNYGLIEETRTLLLEKGENNMKLLFDIKLVEPTEMLEKDTVEIFLNNKTVTKIKNPIIKLEELAMENPFNEKVEPEEESAESCSTLKGRTVRTAGSSRK